MLKYVKYTEIQYHKARTLTTNKQTHIHNTIYAYAYIFSNNYISRIAPINNNALISIVFFNSSASFKFPLRQLSFKSDFIFIFHEEKKKNEAKKLSRSAKHTVCALVRIHLETKARIRIHDPSKTHKCVSICVSQYI